VFTSPADRPTARPAPACTRSPAISPDRWWQTSGKEIIRETADRLITIQSNIMPLLTALAGG